MEVSLYLSTVVLATLLAYVAFQSNQDKGFKSLLIGIFICIAVHVGIKFLGFATNFVNQHPVSLVFTELSAVLIPELVYLLVLSIVGVKPTNKLYFQLTLIPFLAVVLFFYFYTVTEAFTINKFYALEGFIGLYSLTFLGNVLFFVFAIRTIKLSLSNQNIQLSNHNQIILVWIKILMWLLLVRAVLSVGFFVSQFLFARAEWFYLIISFQKYAVAIIYLIATTFTAYYGLRNPILFNAITDKLSLEQSIAIAILPEEIKSNVKKGFAEEEIISLLQIIEQAVVKDQLFLNSDLNPASLSKLLNIPVYKITMALNKGAGKNFNEYINNYRIEFSKKLLLDSAHQKSTIFSIALDSGFASETPFYVAFKKQIGQSPSAFRNSQLYPKVDSRIEKPVD